MPPRNAVATTPRREASNNMVDDTQIVEVPRHGEVEFPSSMSDADVIAAVKRLSTTISATSPPSRYGAWEKLGHEDTPEERANAVNLLGGGVAAGPAWTAAKGAIGGALRTAAPYVKQAMPTAEMASDVLGMISPRFGHAANFVRHAGRLLTKTPGATASEAPAATTLPNILSPMQAGIESRMMGQVSSVVGQGSVISSRSA